MTDFNLESLSCEILRRRRRSVEINLASDQSLITRLRAEIRGIEIDIANRRAELVALRNAKPQPLIPGPISVGPNGRPKKPRLGDVLAGAAEAAMQPIENRLEIRRLNQELRSLQERLEQPRRDLFDRTEARNALIAGREHINNAMREKGCAGA